MHIVCFPLSIQDKHSRFNLHIFIYRSIRYLNTLFLSEIFFYVYLMKFIRPRLKSCYYEHHFEKSKEKRYIFLELIRFVPSRDNKHMVYFTCCTTCISKPQRTQRGDHFNKSRSILALLHTEKPHHLYFVLLSNSNRSKPT